jgi:hypothetical protein
LAPAGTGVVQLINAEIFEDGGADITGLGTVRGFVVTKIVGVGLLKLLNDGSKEVTIILYCVFWTSGENVTGGDTPIKGVVINCPEASILNVYVRPGNGCVQRNVNELNDISLEFADTSVGAGILEVVNVGLADELLDKSK